MVEHTDGLFRNEGGWDMIVVTLDDGSIDSIRWELGKDIKFGLIIDSFVEGMDIALLICVGGAGTRRWIFIRFIDGGRCIESDEKFILDSWLLEE